MSGSRRRLALIVLTCVLATGAGASAEAIVPPTDCGNLTVRSKRYNVKADQLRCPTVRSHTRRYLSTGRRPSGYTCKSYGSETRLKFRCAKGVQVFFAIRR